MFLQIKALKRKCTKTIFKLEFKRKQELGQMYVMHLFDNKTIDLIISYLLDATINSYENVTCKESLFLIYKFQIFNLKVQGPFQDLKLKMDHLPGHFQDK